MPKYRVHLEAVASVSVEVEAETQEEAVEIAFDHTPSQGWDWPDLGDWYFPAEEQTPEGVPARRWSDYIEEIG